MKFQFSNQVQHAFKPLNDSIFNLNLNFNGLVICIIPDTFCIIPNIPRL